MRELPDKTRRALQRAHDAPLSYAVRLVRSQDGRIVAILGEAHLKFAEAKEIGLAVVDSFALRGVETFQKERVTWGRLLAVILHVPRAILRFLSLGAIKDSTIVDAKQLPHGYTVELERAKRMPFGLHVASVYMTIFFVAPVLAVAAPVVAPWLPTFAVAVALLTVALQLHLLALIPAFLLRRFRYCWVVHPFLGILTLRDELMAAGTLRMLEDHPRIPEAVVVMGRAHVAGYAAILIERHGYTPVPFP